MAGLVARYDTAELWPWLLPTAPLAVFGPWLAAIDLDVQRLPDKLLLPMAVIVSMAVIAITILTTQRYRRSVTSSTVGRHPNGS